MVSSTGCVVPNLKVRCSTFSRSTDGPWSCRSIAMMRVFLPAPEGPYTSECGKSPALTIRLSCCARGLW